MIQNFKEFHTHTQKLYPEKSSSLPDTLFSWFKATTLTGFLSVLPERFKTYTSIVFPSAIAPPSFFFLTYTRAHILHWSVFCFSHPTMYLGDQSLPVHKKLSCTFFIAM